MPFGFPCPPSFHHASKTVLLRLKSASPPSPSSPPSSPTTTPLSAFVPPLVPTFYAHPLLFNGHLQTCYTALKTTDPHTVHYARRHLTNPNDGGHFAVDFAVPAFDPPAAATTDDLPERTRHMPPDAPLASTDTTPMLVALHGLSGGSHEVYLRAVLAPLLAGDSTWAACVVNARGCAKSTITTKQLFNARFTQDLRVTVAYLREAFPNRPLYVVGFSLGANILTNYLAEEGDKCVFKAAVVCSNPWNLELCCKNLHRTCLGQMYSRAMGDNLKRLFEQHVHRLDLPAAQVAAVRAGVLMDDFDRALTSKVFGYATVGAYYRDASSVDSLLRVRVPTLIVHARDDPIACDEAAPYDEVQATPWCVMVSTAGGGHLSWFEMGGGRWFAGVVSFLFLFVWLVVWLVGWLVGERSERVADVCVWVA
ncbi:Alpha/Beta hydrolase protein [Morchella snyderi]|nr:Alpha/Beta hydrolase protein [Morchella snyderi]